MIKDKKLKGIVVFAIFFVVFLTGIKAGQILSFGASNTTSISNDGKNYKIPLVIANSTSTQINADFSLFWEVLKIAKEKYYNPNAFDDQKIIYGAINGALSSLDDPYTVFFNPEDSKKLNQDLSGSFGGIGAEIGMKNNQIVIIAPLKNTPAERAGLKPGDKIVKINDIFTINMTVEEAVKNIRGNPGTEVTLDILRDEWTTPKTFTIRRELINIPTLDWKFVGNSNKKIAYIQLYNFYMQAPLEFYKAALAILVQNPKGLILDLRNNPGGYLDVAQNIAGWFMKRGDVFVIEKGKNEQTQKLYVSGNEAFLNIPIVVLVNNGSASASEILAGALRDNRNITLVGEQTFGKGSVQELVYLPDGSSIKITIAEWLTPKGTVINKIGLKPDYEIKTEEDKLNNQKDPQLEEAIKLLESTIK